MSGAIQGQLALHLHLVSKQGKNAMGGGESVSITLLTWPLLLPPTSCLDSLADLP